MGALDHVVVVAMRARRSSAAGSAALPTGAPRRACASQWRTQGRACFRYALTSSFFGALRARP